MAKKIGKPHFTDEFKEEVIRYAMAHPEESRTSIMEKFGVPQASFYKWQKEYKENNGSLDSRGSGNRSSEEAKEIARLKKELRDTQDALEVLKKAIGIVGR